MKYLMLCGILLVTSCTKVYIPPTAPSNEYYGNSNPGGTVNGRDTIEFRITGNATGVKVRYNNSLDGLIQFQTTLPYSISFTNSKDTIFLSLEATPAGYNTATFSPFLSVQIYVNVVLFREASSNDFLLGTLSVSGTFRR